jgi:hypothetical protein
MSISRRMILGPLVIALSVAAAAPTGASSGAERWSQQSHDANVEVSTDSASSVRTCSDIRVRFGDRPAAKSEESFSGPGPRGPLPVKLAKSSGAWIRGSQRRDFSIVACKAADTAETLARVGVSFDRGDLQMHGPDSERWMVFYLIEAPRNAEIDAEGNNGPIQFDGVAGRIRARVTNGPLSFRHCTGTIDARAQNGPISLDGVSGDVQARADNGPISVSESAGNVRVDTENGPIHVRLSGTAWLDGRLDAHAVNGPLTVNVPEGYASGTVVASSGHSPVRCRAAACDKARKTWDDESRRIEFGDGGVIVSLSTVNGPVSVEPAKGE